MTIKIFLQNIITAVLIYGSTFIFLVMLELYFQK